MNTERQEAEEIFEVFPEAMHVLSVEVEREEAINIIFAALEKAREEAEADKAKLIEGASRLYYIALCWIDSSKAARWNLFGPADSVNYDKAKQEIRDILAEIKRKEKAGRMIGRWPANDIRRAFVAGAKWWEWESQGATMWPSDVDKAEAEAESRYPDGKIKHDAPPT